MEIYSFKYIAKEEKLKISVKNVKLGKQQIKHQENVRKDVIKIEHKLLKYKQPTKPRVYSLKNISLTH